MDLKKIIRIFAIFSIIFLFLFVAACESKKVYVCPTGEEVDRPAKCDMYEEQEAIAEKVDAEAQPTEQEPVEEDTSEAIVVESEEFKQFKEKVEGVPAETEPAPDTEEVEASDTLPEAEETPKATESSPDFEFAIFNIERTKYKLDHMAYIATNNLDKTISPHIKLMTKPIGGQKYTQLKRFEIGKFEPGQIREVERKNIDEKIENVDQELLFAIYYIDLSKGETNLVNVTYTIEAYGKANHTSI